MKKREIALVVLVVITGASVVYMVMRPQAKPSRPILTVERVQEKQAEVLPEVPNASSALPQKVHAKRVDELLPLLLNSKQIPSTDSSQLKGDPISYSSDFDQIMKDPIFGGLHSRVESEPRDPIWAAEKESEWRKYFSDNHELAKYDPQDVQCRTTRCEFKMLAVGAPHMTTGDWFKLFFADRETMPGGSTNPGMAFTEKDGNTAVVIQIKYERSGAK